MEQHQKKTLENGLKQLNLLLINNQESCIKFTPDFRKVPWLHNNTALTHH